MSTRTTTPGRYDTFRSNGCQLLTRARSLLRWTLAIAGGLMTAQSLSLMAAHAQGGLPAAAVFAQPPARPRVIATTDGEIDDRCSMIRFLLYSNEFDVEGLIYSSSRFHWLGQTWSGVEWIHAQIEMYSRIYANLRQNSDGYPTPDELRSKVYVGNIKNVGEMDEDSPGSDHIVQVLLDDKPGPVYLQTWGGTNTIARALKKIQTEHPELVDKVSKKAVVYIILDQDDTFRRYIEPNWPKLQVMVSSVQFAVLAYPWRMLMPEAKRVFFERPWMEGNITSNRGSLTGAYESLNGAFRSEGDSPSFMFEIPTGLRSLEEPGYGGWGGRFVPEKPGVTNVWKNAEDDGNVFKPIWRWADAFQNDFAARANWAVRPYSECNHPPVVNTDGPTDIETTPGEVVRLSVNGSTDPDGDQLMYLWWQYRDAGTYKGEAEIQRVEQGGASIKIPADAKPGDTIHVIASVTDSGKPPLTRYARFILTVKAAKSPDRKGATK